MRYEGNSVGAASRWDKTIGMPSKLEWEWRYCTGRRSRISPFGLEGETVGKLQQIWLRGNSNILARLSITVVQPLRNTQGLIRRDTCDVSAYFIPCLSTGTYCILICSSRMQDYIALLTHLYCSPSTRFNRLRPRSRMQATHASGP